MSDSLGGVASTTMRVFATVLPYCVVKQTNNKIENVCFSKGGYVAVIKSSENIEIIDNEKYRRISVEY
jgi:hypothetical protein